MQVILLNKIINLGDVGDKINVKAGYARNYLLPKKKAVIYTKNNLEKINKKQIDLKIRIANLIKLAKERARKISELGVITIKCKILENGKLFGSINNQDIAKEIIKLGIYIERHEIIIPDITLNTIGKHIINIQLHKEVFLKLNVILIPRKRI